MKKHIKKRLGRCYQLAGRHASSNPGSILVHGSIQGTNGGKMLPRIDHAWCVERDGSIYEPITDEQWEPRAFEAFFRPEETARYDHETVLLRSLRTGHWGPWNDIE